ncbi:hypothetical protein BET03_04190 [Thermohalobacter berrensis]|uniref:Histidine kinase domain-containing protein n=2 Tax=Thermohalobacter berrensis TaxID=99594 RepID=A0A419SZI9_9FIRM|nr:hypothetical protein BET03_04190 [Thermohalobacter berrensis]
MLFSFWASLSLPMGYHTILISIFIIISLSLITSSKLYISLISEILTIMYFIVTEFAVLALFSMLTNYDTATIANNPDIKLQYSLIVKGVQFLITFLIYRMKKSFFPNLTTYSQNGIIFFLVLGIFLMGIFIFSLNYVVASKVNIILYESLLLLIYIVFVIFGYIIFKEKTQSLKIKNKLESQKEHIKNLETVISLIRKEKHDFANHINTIYAMCLLNKPNSLERIRTYLEKITNKLKSSYQYFDTGNDYVDGLLLVKSNYAFENNIHFEADFDEAPLELISIDNSELISILSNIIDNAFEAIMSKDVNEQKIVSIYTYIENGMYNISIANTGPKISNEDLDKIFEKGFSTKKENKKDHGYGLNIVKSLIEKNNGEIKVTSTEEETNFLIKFKLNQNKFNNIKSNSKILHTTF